MCNPPIAALHHTRRLPAPDSFRAHPQIPGQIKLGVVIPNSGAFTKSRESLQDRTFRPVQPTCDRLGRLLLCEILQSCIVRIRPGRAFTNISLIENLAESLGPK